MTRASAMAVSASRWPRPDPRNSGRTNSRFISHTLLSRGAQPGATSVRPIERREQQSACRWRIHPWQVRQLLVEVLEAKAEAEGLGVFQEQFAYRRERRRIRRPGYVELASSHGRKRSPLGA